MNSGNMPKVAAKEQVEQDVNIEYERKKIEKEFLFFSIDSNAINKSNKVLDLAKEMMIASIGKDLDYNLLQSKGLHLLENVLFNFKPSLHRNRAVQSILRLMLDWSYNYEFGSSETKDRLIEVVAHCAAASFRTDNDDPVTDRPYEGEAAARREELRKRF